MCEGFAVNLLRPDTDGCIAINWIFIIFLQHDAPLSAYLQLIATSLNVPLPGNPELFR